MRTDLPSLFPPEDPDDGRSTEAGPIALGLAFVGLVTFVWGALCGGLLVWLLT